MLKDPSLLVLDEATSHVDNETELVVQQNVADLGADRTTFVIAHRLSTVRNADRIVVLDDGEIVETGSHERLLDADGLYADLWRVQVGDLDALPDGFIQQTVGSADD
jgi:ATP-binding cassette subfamily B protein